MTDEKQYLDEIGAILDEYEKKVRSISEYDVDPYGKLYELIVEVVEKEKQLREKYGIGDRFNVIRTQLQSALEKYKEEYHIVQMREKLIEKKERKLEENEIVVYLYLFNAQGNVLESWQNILVPRALFDHSVNRPIYSNRDDVERIIRARPNKEQHAYIEAIIKKEDIMNDQLHDQYQHPLFRIRQGAINAENVIAFVYKEKRYSVERGKIVGLVNG